MLRIIYNDEGYLNYDYIMSLPYTFIFIVAARGIGKTYGALNYVLDNDIPTILMRRTQSQVDLINKAAFAPIKALTSDYKVKPLGKQSAGYYVKNKFPRECDYPIIITTALSTICNLRGFDSSDRELIIYDEFIPEKHERPIKDEGNAFLNAYETINRNRELNGQQPVKCLLLANSNDIVNPLFMDLGLVEKAANMVKTGTEIYRDDKRSLCIIMPTHSPISKAKTSTALYKLAGDGDFSEMALHNVFDNATSPYVKSCPLQEYKLLYSYKDIHIYKHKSQTQYYISLHQSGTPKQTYIDKGTFKQQAGSMLIWQYYQGHVYFDTIYSETLFRRTLSIV